MTRAERLHEYESTKVVTDPKSSKPAKVKTKFEATEFLGKKSSLFLEITVKYFDKHA